MSIDDSGFEPIDRLFAEKICPEGSLEAQSFLAYLLRSAREGHLCLFRNLLSGEMVKGLRHLPPSLFGRWLVEQEGRIYLRRNWECEQGFLFHLERLTQLPPAITLEKDRLQEKLKDSRLNEEQKNALFKAAHNALSLITGGPGCGKSFTAAALITHFFQLGIREIAVAAPTGKATANLRAALGSLAESHTIKTVHALVNKKRIYADLIVVDEASMIDAELMHKLFSCVKRGARLVLLGDPNQLPPVETGSFFADLAEESSLTAHLKSCLRTELEEIIGLAGAVKEGRSIPYGPIPSLNDLIKIVLDQKMQLLTPMRKGLFGTNALNQRLLLEHEKRGGKEVPIMVTVNDCHLNLFNGDCGLLCREKKIALFSGDRIIDLDVLPKYEYGYALSVHKSQGSEYDKVMVLLPKGSEIFGREMLYTALTRAKKQVVVLAHEGVVEALVRKPHKRFSGIGLKMVLT